MFAVSLVGTEPRKLRANGCRIDVAHEFSDQLLLAAQCAVSLDRPGVADCSVKSFIERKRCTFGLGQADQLLAKILQCELLAFSRAFAGL
jgi:hypothetical protein